MKVLALYNPHHSQEDEVHYLELVFYLLLVNNDCQFPRLTSCSPRLAPSRHSLPADTPTNSEQPEAKESDLHLEVSSTAVVGGWVWPIQDVFHCPFIPVLSYIEWCIMSSHAHKSD